MRYRVVSIAAILMLLPVALLQGGTASAEDDLLAALSSIEKGLWEAWKIQDAKPFEAHMADGSVNITAGGIISGKGKIIEEVTGGKCEVRGYSLSDMKVQRLGADTAILTYKASQDATCEGNKIPAEVFVGSVFVNKGGKWLSASYQETAAKK